MTWRDWLVIVAVCVMSGFGTVAVYTHIKEDEARDKEIHEMLENCPPDWKHEEAAHDH